MGWKASGYETNSAPEKQGHGGQELREQLSQVLLADKELSDEPRVRQSTSDLQRHCHVWNVHWHVDIT